MTDSTSPIARHGPLLDAVRGLRWPAARRVPGGLPGAHRSRMRGVSPEFTEYRPYRQGDDPRRLDWRLLARSDRAYIRLADDHAVLATHFLLDASASMGFPADSLAKWETARSLTLALGSVVHAAGDPVALVVPAAQGGVRLAPRSRRGMISDLARALAEVSPGGDAPLAPSFARLPRQARIVVISDFLGDADALLKMARERVASGAEVHAVHVVAREELDPPRGVRLALDPELPDVRGAIGGQGRQEYLDAFAEWRKRLAADWRRAGAGYTQVGTDAPLDRAVRRIIVPSERAAAQSHASRVFAEHEEG